MKLLFLVGVFVFTCSYFFYRLGKWDEYHRIQRRLKEQRQDMALKGELACAPGLQLVENILNNAPNDVLNLQRANINKHFAVIKVTTNQFRKDITAFSDNYIKDLCD